MASLENDRTTVPALTDDNDLPNLDPDGADQIPEKENIEADLADGVDERVLVRRLDRFILPVVMTLYLLSFLDRVNIGNARLYHLEADLGMTANQFSTAVSVLFATYIASELPSNLALQKLRPSRWIAFITVSWGIVATCTGAVQSYAGLIVCRVLLGLFEGGLFPGMAVYLTLFYSKRELALRVGYLFVSAALAGAVGGLLAFAIGKLDGRHGISGWRWIFIIEGIPAAVFGAATWWLLADEPSTAYYLSPGQKKKATDRLITGQQGFTSLFTWADVRLALTDWTVWAFALALFGADTMLYGFSTFLPTIIAGIDPSWSREKVQALTIPCYTVGAVVYLITAWLSDRRQLRAPFVVAAGLVSISGYAILLAAADGRVVNQSGAMYGGCFLVAAGLYVHVGLPLAWLPANCPRYGKRTTATGLQLTIGNVAGILSSFIYTRAESPYYRRGHAVTIGMVCFSTTVYGLLGVYFWWQNGRRRIALKQAGMIDQFGAKTAKAALEVSANQVDEDGFEPKPETKAAEFKAGEIGPEEQMAFLGDRSPWFKYTF